MSKVKIQGHASGTGVLTVTAPNTSTDRTITLPDSTGTILDENSSLPAANLTGTVADARISTLTASKLTGALPAIDGSALTGIDGGKILQVKYAYWYPTSHHTITNSGHLSDLDITITPTASNSRFLTLITLGTLRQQSTDKYVEIRYHRDSTAIDGGGFGLGYSNYYGTYMSYNYKPHSYNFMHQETAGSGSRVYKVKTNTDGNWVVHQNSANTHIIMEVAG